MNDDTHPLEMSQGNRTPVTALAHRRSHSLTSSDRAWETAMTPDGPGRRRLPARLLRTLARLLFCSGIMLLTSCGGGGGPGGGGSGGTAGPVPLVWDSGNWDQANWQ
jgi:hypothetical protein